MIEIKAGEWFVERNWSYLVRKAIRVTKQTIFYIDAIWNNKERLVRIDKVVFSCPDEQMAKLVAERLMSSDSLCSEERRNAELRRQDRNAKIIAAARTEVAA